MHIQLFSVSSVTLTHQNTHPAQPYLFADLRTLDLHARKLGYAVLNAVTAIVWARFSAVVSVSSFKLSVVRTTPITTHHSVLINMRPALYLGPIALVPLVLSLLLLQTPTSSDAQLLPQAPVDMVAADALTSLYMRLEHALWLVIGSTSADSAEKLRRIHETHLTLFATDFREKGVQLSRLDVDQRHLLEAIGTVNMTVSVLRDSYLHENARDRQRDNALNYARFGVNMSHHMETLFNVTEFSDFYHYVARVRVVGGDAAIC